MSRARLRSPALLTLLTLLALLLGGCSTLPPGSTFPRTESHALECPQDTSLGRQFLAAAQEHGGNSGFRIIPVGADGFLIRMQMIEAAEKTLDLQYFIFRGDDTGQLLTGAVLRAADRGVRVRVLVDDGESAPGDEQLARLAGHASLEVRVFNPFAYRGSVQVIRAIEYLANISRLDYRMHNKLMVVDNAVALMGGRNIGDQYFQIDPDSQFADDDVLAAGPIAQQLSDTFDEFWNHALSIPVRALDDGGAGRAALDERRTQLVEQRTQLQGGGAQYVLRIDSGEPFGAIIAGRLPLVWAHARVIADSPDKREVEAGTMVGRLMRRSVAAATAATQSELLMITPYLIPGKEGMQLFEALRARGVRVRILTSSLESSTVLLAQAGYMGYRAPLLERGVELYEIRSMLGNTKGSGETSRIARFGNYSLHAKLFVFDRRTVFFGSMNFDQRSLHLNTELGLMIDSPVLAEQVASRFAAMVQPANAYAVALRPAAPGAAPVLVWRTQEGAAVREYDIEPARSAWQRTFVKLLRVLPLDDEL